MRKLLDEMQKMIDEANKEKLTDLLEQLNKQNIKKIQLLLE